jgi:serum/glucocorticoid-regulated kinase 2
MLFRKTSAHNDASHGPVSPLVPHSPLSHHNKAAHGSGGRSHSSGISLGSKKIVLEDFNIMKVIGRGTSGKVFLATNKSTGDKLYALKMLKKASVGQRGEVEHTKSEQLVMARIRSPFIAKLNYSFQNETHLFLAMDFVNGGELYQHLNHSQFFEEDRAKFYTAEIILGLDVLHSYGIIYRDLKPENILLTHRGHIVMVDFGLAKHGLGGLDDRTMTFCGTPTYIAPEILRGENYTKAIDYWSLGIMVFEMISGSPPFYSENDANVYAAIVNAPLEIPDYFSIEAADFISSLLERNEKDRLRESAVAKKHGWFRDIDWIALSKLQVAPPFIPDVKDDKDLGMINKELLNEDVDDKCLDDEDPFGEFTSPRKKDDFDKDFDFASFTYDGSS